MNDEERIRDYLRRRADVRVPDDLEWPAAERRPSRRWAISFVGVWGRAAIGGLAVLVLAISVLLGVPGSTGPGVTSIPSAGASAQPGGGRVGGSFPTEVAGLPVVTVAEAVALLEAGRLDGQAVAVAGYFDAVYPSCPYPGRYIGPLEPWCSFTTFADTRADAQLCEPLGSNGTTCHGPTGIHLTPFFMTETSGSASANQTYAIGGEPVALVLVGHAGDPLQWQCTAATRDLCSRGFVIDRVAWAQGQDVPVTAPQTGSQLSGKPITPTMTLARVAAAAGLGDNLLTGAPLRAGDIATVDPRWNLAGDDVVWLLRSTAPGGPAQGAETSPETVWLVDDATGKVIDSHPLEVDSSYRPARWWPMATVHGSDCCTGSLAAFSRVQSSDGTVVFEGMVSGSATSSEGSTTFGGGGYGSPPLVLPAGSYTITDWVADVVGGVAGTPSRQCSTQVTLRPLDDVMLNADFRAGRTCTFGPAPSSSPGP